ncbi:MAG: hypothetical protein ACR652_07695 [Methylocystis sp.]|uniref:hypothetical protein n=1 Tax=Methylocystis sp. TaxID=1911079 RepID=UPI003DA3FF71
MNMTTQPIAESNDLPNLPEELAIARRAIELPEIQEMMRKLATYNLGIYMPHMHDEKTGAFKVLPAGVTQVEDNLKISFQSEDPQGRSYVPVAWLWRDGPTPGAKCAAICMTVHHAPLGAEDSSL